MKIVAREILPKKVKYKKKEKIKNELIFSLKTFFRLRIFDGFGGSFLSLELFYLVPTTSLRTKNTHEKF
jgi:hypothetical protein